MNTETTTIEESTQAPEATPELVESEPTTSQEDTLSLEEIVVPEEVAKAKTRSISEVGMVNTVDNTFFLADVLSLFTEYQPTNPLLSAEAIRNLGQQALAGIEAVDQKDQDESVQKYIRKEYFDALRVYATRIINALEACGASKLTIANARTEIRKIQGAPPKKSSAENYRSNSQRSFPQLLEHFKKLTLVCAAEPLFDPSKDDIKVAGQQARATNMATANNNCNYAQAVADVTRKERNAIFNNPSTGLVDVCLASKNEVKATYGASSAQYELVRGLTFKRIY